MKFSFNLEEIKYIKITLKDAIGSVHTLKGGIKYMNKENILATSKIEINEKIVCPQEVSLSIICNDGLYKTKTVLTKFENEEPYLFLTMAIPQGCEYQQNREYFRVPMKYPCKCRLCIDENEKIFETETMDISANGVTIYLPTLEVAEHNTTLELDINDKRIEVESSYIRSEKFDNGFCVAFHFEQIRESDRDWIAQACMKKQLELKKRYS